MGRMKKKDVTIRGCWWCLCWISGWGNTCGKKSTEYTYQDGHVQNKVYSLIIDGGNCVNVGNRKLVEKLNFHTTKYLIPYKLKWLNDSSELKRNKQVLVTFILVNIVMRYYMMLYQYKLVIYYLIEHENRIKELCMIEWQIYIPFR